MGGGFEEDMVQLVHQQKRWKLQEKVFLLCSKANEQQHFL